MHTNTLTLPLSYTHKLTHTHTHTDTHTDTRPLTHAQVFALTSVGTQEVILRIFQPVFLLNNFLPMYELVVRPERLSKLKQPDWIRTEVQSVAKMSTPILKVLWHFLMAATSKSSLTSLDSYFPCWELLCKNIRFFIHLSFHVRNSLQNGMFPC